MKVLIIAILLVTHHGLKGQRSMFEFTLKPSFTEGMHVRFSCENEMAFLAINNYYFSDTTLISSIQYAPLFQFLKDYSFTSSNNVKEKRHIVDGDTMLYSVIGFDGIITDVYFNDEGDVKSCSFWSPAKKTENFYLCQMLFELLDEAFTTARHQRYFNELKAYYLLPQSNTLTNIPTEFAIVKDCYMVVEQMPVFPGGKEHLTTYMNQVVAQNEYLQSTEYQGEVWVEFIVTKNGSVVSPRILKNGHKSINDELIMLIQAMPSWQPGVHNGKKVNVSYRLKIEI